MQDVTAKSTNNGKSSVKAAKDRVEIGNRWWVGDAGAAHDVAAGGHGVGKLLECCAGARDVGEIFHVRSIFNSGLNRRISATNYDTHME